VESTCYYLQSEQWQSSTENLIQDLGTAAERTLVAQAEVHTALTDASAHLEGISEASQELVAAQQQLQASMGAAETRAQTVADSIELARDDVAQLNSMVTTGTCMIYYVSSTLLALLVFL
jgi:chromosome segregation ATPase